MISTVTTTTVAIVNSIDIVSSLSLVAILLLIALLIQKEVVTGAAPTPRTAAYGRILNFAIAPLLLGFVFIAVVRLSDFFH